jgi:hypothetical protein
MSAIIRLQDIYRSNLLSDRNVRSYNKTRNLHFYLAKSPTTQEGEVMKSNTLNYNLPKTKLLKECE